MKVAAIDIGSNSVHMIIAAARSATSFEVIDREKDMIRLGANTFRTGRLSDAACAAGLDSLERFRRLIDRHRVSAIVAVATSAVREAENGQAFLAAVRERTGIDARIVSGTEEARLVHLAVTNAIDLTQRRALIFDIGGGSVEAVVGDAENLSLAETLRLGVLRLRDLVGDEDPIGREARRRLESEVRKRAGPVLNNARALGFDIVIGTAGTILNLGLAARLRRGDPAWTSPNGLLIERQELQALAERLNSMRAAERAREPGVDEQRIETIHIGGLLLCELLDLAGASGLVLCDASVREGLVLDWLRSAGSNNGLARGDGDIRRQSVLDLCAQCGQSDAHARQVATLSLQLFDQLQPLHRFGWNERLLMEMAARTHDIGRHISFERHEHHSYYIIRNAELRGFSESEIEMVALVARYHRKAAPKGRHPEFAALRPRERRLVRVLAGILRIAEGLDRGHRQAVSAVNCAIEGDTVRIVVRSASDVGLELWAARRKASHLARALDRRVELVLEEKRVQSGASA